MGQQAIGTSDRDPRGGLWILLLALPPVWAAIYLLGKEVIHLVF